MMDLTQFDLNPLVSMANKVAPALNYMTHYTSVHISTVAYDIVDAVALARMLEPRTDKRFEYEPLTQEMFKDVTRIKGKTRALVIMTDKITLSSESILSLKYSLLTTSATCCSYVGPGDFMPISEDFIVDMEGKPFYKRPKTRK